jgi:hypothetical protein
VDLVKPSLRLEAVHFTPTDRLSFFPLIRQTEQVTVAKVTGSRQIGRKDFRKEKSVFKEWPADTKESTKACMVTDTDHWSVYVDLIHDEADYQGVLKILKQHYLLLKTIYTNAVSSST